MVGEVFLMVCISVLTCISDARVHDALPNDERRTRVHTLKDVDVAGGGPPCGGSPRDRPAQHVGRRRVAVLGGGHGRMHGPPPHAHGRRSLRSRALSVHIDRTCH